MAYYKNLEEYIQALDGEGLLFRVKRPINKDTEMHPLVRWQFRGLGKSSDGRFTSKKSMTQKARSTTYRFS
jgi:hypothetical protein